MISREIDETLISLVLSFNYSHFYTIDVIISLYDRPSIIYDVKGCGVSK